MSTAAVTCQVGGPLPSHISGKPVGPTGGDIPHAWLVRARAATIASETATEIPTIAFRFAIAHTILDVHAMDDLLVRRARACRAEVASGALRGARLLQELLAVPPGERDGWLDELLGLGPPPPDDPALPRGAVPYLPCGVEEILAFVRDSALGPGDVLVDLGAGAGRVLVLAHLLSGARGTGIELQEHLVDIARAATASLGIEGVTFVHADATELPLEGSHFFLYAPCNGDLLACLVARIAEVARRRPIVVGTVGLELEEPWLRAAASSCHGLSLYRGVR